MQACRENDPATIIALALRKRFAQMNQVTDSPERDDREDRDSFSDANDSATDTHFTPKFTPQPKVTTGRRQLFVQVQSEAVKNHSTDTENEARISPVPFGQHLLRKTVHRI